MYNVKTKSDWPVSSTDVKSHLKIDPDDFDNDNYLDSITIPSATRYCENFIGKDIALTKNVLTIDSFSGSDVRINSGNLISIEYVITDSSTLVNDYTIAWNRDYFILEFPSLVTSDPLRVEFTTGYNEGQCPEDIKSAILIKCCDEFDVERSSYILSSYKKIDGIGIVERKLMPHKVFRW